MRKRHLFLLVLPVLPLLTLPPWFGARREQARISAISQPSPYTFPPGFLWGTATSAYQVEGTSNSDWGAFEKGMSRYPPELREKKTGYDELLAADLQMAAAMKHNAYRF